jgi:hypothetical protein
MDSLLARPMTPPRADVLAAIEAGPIAARDALPIAHLDRLLDPAPLSAETGWCTLPDGVAYAAVRTEMPGVTGEMIDWWFDWHQRDPLRYQAWFPGAHADISWDPPSVEGAKAHWNAVHHPVEDVGLGMDLLWIAFLAPTDLGFSTDALDDSNVATIVAGRVGDRRRRVQHTLMAHVFLNSDEGLVQRSRFWIGAVLRPNGPPFLADAAGRLINRPTVRRRMLPPHTGRVMADHCAREYANLSALLPELFAEFHASV